MDNNTVSNIIVEFLDGRKFHLDLTAEEMYDLSVSIDTVSVGEHQEALLVIRLGKLTMFIAPISQIVGYGLVR